MKNILIIGALMASTAMSAQSLAQDQVSPKDLKKQQKAELAEFKTKQKLALAEFMQRQKKALAKASGQAAETPAETTKPTDASYKDLFPEMKTAADSVAYLYGAFRAGGLKEFIVKQFNVDTTYMDDFYRGISDRVCSDNTDPKTNAYNAGINIAGQIEVMSKDFQNDYYSADPDKHVSIPIIAKSIIDAMTGANPYTPEIAQRSFTTIMEKRQKENLERKYAPNREAGAKFLEENKSKAGVVTLPSGVQYKILKLGTGAKPKATDKVRVNYEGHLIDGTEFDSSYKRNKPSEFKLNQVIRGWTEAMQEFPVGTTAEIYIPYDMAYGERNTGKIDPYSTLIFKIDLLDILPEEETAAPKKSATSNMTSAERREAVRALAKKNSSAKAAANEAADGSATKAVKAATPAKTIVPKNTKSVVKVDNTSMYNNK